MASSYFSYAGDGSTTLFDVDFDLGYLKTKYVYVYTGGIANYEDQVGYTWISSTQIELDEAVDVDTTLYIRRIIPRDEPVNDYEDGAIMKEANIDASFAQLLMILEEMSDGFNDITEAETVLISFEAKYLGSFTTAPTEDNYGDALIDGALYFNSITKRAYAWDDSTSAWIDMRGTGTLTYEPDEDSVLANFEVWCADTSSAKSRDLPASPEDGVEVTIRDDKGLAGTNNITVGRNGNTIMGLEEDMTISTDWSWVRLKWREGDTDWRVIGGGVGAHVAFSPTDMLDYVYPVGAVYVSTSVIDPSLSLGIGTWQRIGQGQVISAVGTALDQNDVSKTVYSGSNDGEWVHTVTLSQMPVHSHDINSSSGSTASNNKTSLRNEGGTDSEPSTACQDEGGGESMNITNPMFGVYLWERTE